MKKDGNEMAFKIAKPVTNCPISRGSIGKLVMSPEVIAEIAGTMEKQKEVEWAVQLVGERKEGGMEVEVTGWIVPEDLERSGGHIHIPEGEMPDGVIGVLHSHHGLNFHKFSSIDREKLNTKYPVSIVVWDDVESGDDEGRLLGWGYEAEGRVKLPCGSMGVVAFKVVPKGVEDWPIKWGANAGMFTVHDPGSELVDLGDCNRTWGSDKEEDPYFERVVAECALVPEVQYVRRKVFGRGEGKMNAEIPEDKVRVVSKGGYGSYKVGGSYNSYWPEDNYYKGWASERDSWNRTSEKETKKVKSLVDLEDMPNDWLEDIDRDGGAVLSSAEATLWEIATKMDRADLVADVFVHGDEYADVLIEIAEKYWGVQVMDKEGKE